MVRPGDAIVGDDDGVVVVPAGAAQEVINIAHQREEVEAVIKAQLEIEQCSPGKYYPFNDNTWKLFEEKTGKKALSLDPGCTFPTTTTHPKQGGIIMARLPAATRDTVPAGQEATFDEITQNGSAVPPYGPGSVMVHVPEASKHATALNQYLRNDASLPMKAAELAMLVVAAREMDCQHIWNAHAASARDAGVPAAVVDAIRDNTALPDLAPRRVSGHPLGT